MTTHQRLPETRPLSQLLPKGREGGLEFARIVDLLLFQQARRQGRNLMLFSDRAGDYRGLDSFDDGDLRRDQRTGYQYKFYPSPLSNDHRKEIVAALEKVQAAENEKPRLQTWVLVTPDDLVESAQRKGGGDVAWFDGLRARLKLNFQLEHWGHKKLQALFLETPSLCLFYYPELLAEGATRRRSIEETRLVYEQNLRDTYGRIEFVGMSVYKPEATRGVPMEHIYIPLAVVGEQADDRNDATPRSAPHALLQPPGGRHVILGDPGSGKSTLLKFLALAGTSAALQQRYEIAPDRRLPLLVVLRRYADALKAEADLSLLEYLLRNLRADFSLPHLDQAFLDYYLETGQALLLFDGMDELPNPQFKQTVRDRIHCLLNAYPGNSAIVTSRIVGYENPYCFDESGYRHHKLARLGVEEMQRFVADWYAVRIDNPKERRDNVDDLCRILRDSRHQAIGELAANPLLLTIIALVHRIDAILPDQRVVLYQKCTETLLITWHTGKNRTDAAQRRGKIERYNRQRIEALAYWMHEQAGGAGSEQRAVVPYTQARDFLSRHIREQERLDDPDDAQDMAEEFLAFVQARAGLLLEVGDGLYSFVHLTFQEYLTAAHLTARMELQGAASLWQDIAGHIADPRWHEVLRLLLAGLRADASQDYLLECLLKHPDAADQPHATLLLGGLLLDGIAAAEHEAQEIFRRLFSACCRIDDAEWIGRLIGTLKALLAKTWDTANSDCLELGLAQAWRNATPEDRSALLLTALAAGLDETRLARATAEALRQGPFPWHRWLLAQTPDATDTPQLQPALTAFVPELAAWATASLWTNHVAALAEAVLAPTNTTVQSFILRLYLLQLLENGPFLYFGRFPAALALDRALALALALDRARDLARALARARARDRARARARARAQDLENLYATLQKQQSTAAVWHTLLTDADLAEDLPCLLTESFDLHPRALWQEALRTGFLPRIPQRLWLYRPTAWPKITAQFEIGASDDNAVYAAAWLLLHDIWLYICGAYSSPQDSPLHRLAELTRPLEHPSLKVAHCLRDLAHGQENRADDLQAMVESDDPAYRQLFRDAMWID